MSSLRRLHGTLRRGPSTLERRCVRTAAGASTCFLTATTGTRSFKRQPEKYTGKCSTETREQNDRFGYKIKVLMLLKAAIQAKLAGSGSLHSYGRTKCEQSLRTPPSPCGHLTRPNKHMVSVREVHFCENCNHLFSRWLKRVKIKNHS